jgi:hypothetical protein
MLNLITKPPGYGIAIAIITAILTWLYTRTIEPDQDKVTKTFYKTLVAGLIAAAVLSYVAHRPEPISTEPFNAVVGGAASVVPTPPAAIM